MQTLTSSDAKGLNRLIWRALLPLLALFVGLGSSFSAHAQTVSSTYYDDAITLLQQPSGSTTVTTNNYAGQVTAGEAPYNTYVRLGKGTPSPNLGVYDITGTTVLSLDGGSAEVDPPASNKTASYTISAARLLYRVYMQGSASVPAYKPVALPRNGSLNGSQLYSVSGVASDNNLLAGLTVGGTYILEVTFQTDTQASNGSVNTDQDPTTSSYQASFTLDAPLAPTLSPNNIQLAADGSVTPTSYYFPTSGTNPQFPGHNFTSSQNAGGTPGAFDINNGQLRLDDTNVTTTEAGSNTISGVVLYYRVRKTSSGGGAFQPITLTQTGTTTGGVRTFSIAPAPTDGTTGPNANPQPNLIAAAAVDAIGTYAIDVYYQASGTNSATGTPFTITYPPTGYSTATFTVGGTPIAVTIWTGAHNDNWFDAGNWTNGVPNENTNALVRDLGAGNAVPYPNIRSDFQYHATVGGPITYDNTGSGPAKTRNFVMGGSTQAARSIARLVVGQLRVYGTFDNTYDSFIQRENTIMEFAGGNQTITGGTFIRVDISGGGVKTLQGVMNVSESLNFLTPNVYANAMPPVPTLNPYATLAADAGVLATNISAPTASVVVLADRSSSNANNGAQLNGETDTSYLYGFVRTSRAGVMVGETRTYGNIGITLTFTGVNNPNDVDITRNTVEAYSPLATNYGIRRIIGVRPSNQTTNNGGLAANIVFHYRNSETKRLNGASTTTYGTGRIPEQRLTIFVSTNAGNTFQLVGRDAAPDTVNNNVTRTGAGVRPGGVSTFATFTLGDTDHPLPVTLVAFDAKRLGDNAQVTWATADETNNAGFEVQVSTDGSTYRKLAFVSPKSANSQQYQTYSYSDVESGKSGVRYYRLRQVDLDGKDFYSPVKAVSFATPSASAADVIIYPNPSTGSEQTTIAVQSPVAGKGRIQVLDMTGRNIVSSDITTVAGVTEFAVPTSTELSAGIYLVKVTLPSGEVKTVRMQKR